MDRRDFEVDEQDFTRFESNQWNYKQKSISYDNNLANHRPLDRFFKRLMYLSWTEISKTSITDRATGYYWPSLAFCEQNPLVTDGFSSQRASKVESDSAS